MASESEHVHVLLLPYPSQGHINPLLQLGKPLLLAATTHVRCTLAVTPYLMVQCQDPCPESGVHLAQFSDGFDRAEFVEVEGDVAAYLAGLEPAGSCTVDELLRSEAERGRPVNAVVYDSLLQPWVPRVARRRGAAFVPFFTQAPVANIAYAHAHAGTESRAGLPAGLTPEDLPTFLSAPDETPAYRDILLSQFVGLDAADHVLVNSFHDLQTLESDYMASTWEAKTVGPTVPSAYLDNRLPDDICYGFHLYT